MTDIKHYLEIVLDGATFLLPHVPGIQVEVRENMQVEAIGVVAARRHVQGAAWPALALDRNLMPCLDSPWTRAVFLPPNERPVGLLINDMKLVPADSLRIEPFIPLGARAPGDPLVFDAAAMTGRGLTLVFSPPGLTHYLLAQEAGHGDR